ncbi:MAG: GIY-YIG nuclease family protein [Acidobacteriota bacterium]
MLSKESRREAARQFREKKPSVGIYAVRCISTGRVWIGASRNLEATKNGCWFSLRSGLHRDKPLQDEWNAQGESAFQYEIVAVLKDDTHPLEIADSLKTMRLDCMKQLNAQPLL